MTQDTLEFVTEFAKTQLPDLQQIEQYAKENYVPICQKPLANFLHYIVVTLRPRKILEIGTAIGYSAIIMASSYVESQIDTIEIDTDRLSLAEHNFQKYCLSHRIKTHCGDAGDFILNLQENSYDLIFLDGPKTQYYSYLASLKRILKPGGVLIADNIFQRGMTTGEVETKNKFKSTVEKMGDFVKAISHDKFFSSTILPFGDGVLLSTKLF